MRTGTIGDRYRIARRLGAGGMARVYLCWDERLQLWCAIKVMTGDAVTDPVLRARFVQEARTLARLGHRNLVRLFELVDHVEYPYMVMEYLRGGSVAARLARKDLHLHQAVVMAAETCSALQAAHEAGVIHRDIKPQNLLLDADGTLKVSDFGVARVELELRLTMSNMSLGTIAYMPPEQQRDAATVDHRADIYAAGATLYALVTGRRPTALLTGDRERAIGLLPAEVRPVVRRSTEVHRRDRYESALLMEAALRELLARIPLPSGIDPVVDQPESTPTHPPEDGELVLEAGEIEGTERPWAGAAVSLSRTPPSLELRSRRSSFRAIDPSADSTPSATVVLPPAGGGRLSMALLVGMVLTAAVCAGGVVGFGTLGALGMFLSW